MICILGGGGCFALNLARYIGSEACFGVGRTGPKPAPFWLIPKGYNFFELHLVIEQERLFQLLDNMRPDIVVNYAAQGEGADSFKENAWLFYQMNVLAMSQIVEYLRHKKWLKRFVQISTSELYGSVTAPSKETDPLKSSSPYANSKATFDTHLEIMHRIHGFPMNIIRPSNCYTPGQQLHRIIPKALLCAEKGEKLPLQGGGKCKKSYLHADDLSRAVMAVLDVGEIGETYNCGPREPISIREVVEVCADSAGVSWGDLVEETPDRVGQDSCYWLDSSKLGALGWFQTIDLEEGVSGMVQWVRQYPELKTMKTDFIMRP
jgi:dTDP-glucose 4,6-dehydratase